MKVKTRLYNHPGHSLLTNVSLEEDAGSLHTQYYLLILRTNQHMCTTLGERRLISIQIGYFLQNDAQMDQIIPCCSRVMSILTSWPWADRQTDSHSDYSAHLWVVQNCLDFKHVLYRHDWEVWASIYLNNLYPGLGLFQNCKPVARQF